jgi:hypothetical protein
MLKRVLWISAGCAALLAALALSNCVRSEQDGKAAREAPAAEAAAAPAAAVAPEPAPLPTAKAAPTPEELQVQEDAAATGMTTLEPEAGEAPPTSPPQP